MKTITIAILMFAAATSIAFATAQYPDKIIYEGKTYSLHTNPMEPYFAKHPDKAPKRNVMVTALWRGYVATFEFKANGLVLKDIEIAIWDEAKDGVYWKSVKDDLVPKGKDLLIDWFTGILVLPHGKLVKYVHMGYDSTYSEYILLEVKQGKLTGKRTCDHVQYEKFRESQRLAQIEKHVAEMRKNGDLEESSDNPDAGDGK